MWGQAFLPAAGLRPGVESYSKLPNPASLSEFRKRARVVHNERMDLWALADLCTPWCFHVAVTLRLAHHIAAGNQHLPDLATAAHADPDALARILRHLIAKGLFEEPTPGHFTLNQAAEPLLDENFHLGFDLDGFGGRMAHAWSTLLQTVRTGQPAYHQIFGQPFWQDLEANPEIAAQFDALMGPQGHGIPDPAILLNPAAWPEIRTLVDIGGGTGALLAEVLKAHPHLSGTLVDLPRTIARAAGTFEAAGLLDRVTLIGQSFFAPLPAGADVYLLKNVLADWPDAEALQLLKRCAQAARPNGRLLLLGGVSPEETASPELLMLVLLGGKNRTLNEFRQMAAEAGLTVTAFGKLPSGRFTVECRPSGT